MARPGRSGRRRRAGGRCPPRRRRPPRRGRLVSPHRGRASSAGRKASASSSGEEPLRVGVGDVEAADARSAAARGSRRRRGRRSATARRCPTSTRSRTPPGRRRATAARTADTSTSRSASSTASPRACQRVGALAADLDRRVGRRALAEPARRERRAARRRPARRDLALGVAGRRASSPAARRSRSAWAAPSGSAARASPRPTSTSSRPGGERVERARVPHLHALRRAGAAHRATTSCDVTPAGLSTSRTPSASQAARRAAPRRNCHELGEVEVGGEAGRAAVPAAALRAGDLRHVDAVVGRPQRHLAQRRSPSRAGRARARRPRCPRPSAGGRRRPRSSSRRLPSRVVLERQVRHRQQSAVEALTLVSPRASSSSLPCGIPSYRRR